MKENILNQVKQLRREISNFDKRIENNNKILNNLKKNKKVIECLKLLEENNKININKHKYVENEKMLIENNCSCELSLFLESVSDPYEGRRYNKFRCLECGRIFEMLGGDKKHITSDKKFETLHKEYIGYLLNYNELDASDIMFYKYNNKLFKSLIDEGIEKNKALNLIRYKNIERDDI